MKYEIENCPKVEYVVQVDDDAFRKNIEKVFKFQKVCRDLNIIKPNDVDLTLQRQ